MVISFSIGSKCAIMLPRKVLNGQITPAKGMVINRLVGDRSLILIEEVWQFKGLKSAPLISMCFPSIGRIKDSEWGWTEVPAMLEADDHIVLPVRAINMMIPNAPTLEAMITKSIGDFKSIYDLT